MTKQAENFIELCRFNDEAQIRRALSMVSSSVRKEIVEHYGGNIDTAVTHLHLGTR